MIFASALDCWGFGLGRFVNFWSKKLNLNKNLLMKYIFEDYSFNDKTMKIAKITESSDSSRPMFASMILDPIWEFYDTAIRDRDPSLAAQLAKDQVNGSV